MGTVIGWVTAGGRECSVLVFEFECSESRRAGLRRSIEIVSLRPRRAIVKFLFVRLTTGNGPS